MAKRVRSLTPDDLATSSKRPRADNYQSIATIPTPSTVTPWQSSQIPLRQPSLPDIPDKALSTACFTHPGWTKTTSEPNYERLEWVGDSYLYLLSTLLITSTFPTHPPGKCAQIREQLVKNETLAIYARQYGFEARMRVPSEFWVGVGGHGDRARKATEHNKQKILGDIFEAYVAGVVMSDPANGVARVSAWLKELWSMTIKSQIVAEEARKDRIAQTGVDLGQIPPAKDRLCQLIGCKGVNITYREGQQGRDSTGLITYGMQCYYEGLGEKDLLLGVGRATKKAEAGMAAAQQALDDTALMARLIARKEARVQELASQMDVAVDRGGNDSSDSSKKPKTLGGSMWASAASRYGKS